MTDMTTLPRLIFLALLLSLPCRAFDLTEAVRLLEGEPGTVRIPAGQHVVTNTISLAPHQWLVGEGAGTVLEFGSTPSAIVLATGCKVRDLAMRGTGAIGISTVQTASLWSIDTVIVSGFADNIRLVNSYVGTIRDVVSTGGGCGLRITKKWQTSTRLAGENLFAHNRWGIMIEGQWHMGLTISGAVIEGNTEGGIHVIGDIRQMSIRHCYFDSNGPGLAGPDLLVQGNPWALTITENAFFISRKNVVIDAAQRGEVSRNYIGGRVPLTVGGAANGLTVRDNDMPFQPR